MTANHGHAAMFGVFGMLALAVLVFCLRAMQTDAAWEGTLPYVRLGFWGLNAGLGLMVVSDLFPGGVLQLWDSLSNGYWHARQIEFFSQPSVRVIEWLRMPGDILFIVGGIMPVVYLGLRMLANRQRPGEVEMGQQTETLTEPTR